jgi:drug/metabolite transporter (DMT)-like permease
LVPANLEPVRLGWFSVLLLGIRVAATLAQLTMNFAYSKIEVNVGALLVMLVPVINVIHTSTD